MVKQKQLKLKRVWAISRKFTQPRRLTEENHEKLVRVYDDQINEDEMGRTYGTHGRNKECAQDFFRESRKEEISRKAMS
jgi:hypothetical protein